MPIIVCLPIVFAVIAVNLPIYNSVNSIVSDNCLSQIRPVTNPVLHFRVCALKRVFHDYVQESQRQNENNPVVLNHFVQQSMMATSENLDPCPKQAAFRRLDSLSDLTGGCWIIVSLMQSFDAVYVDAVKFFWL